MTRLALNILFANLAVSYFFLVRRGQERSLTPPIVWPIFAAVGVLFLFMPPVFSGDLYEYLIRGRILAIYHESPYLRFPESFPEDILFSYSSWPHAPDAYGPLFLYLKSLPAFLFRNSIPGMIAAMKMINFVFMGAAVYFFARIAELLKKNDPDRLVRLFAFCPILLVTTLLDGQNDILMTAFILGAVYFLFKRRISLASLFWGCAFLVKYSAILSLPFLMLAAVKLESERTMRFPWKPLFGQALLVLAFSVAMYAPVWAGPETFAMMGRLGERFYTNTIPYAAQTALGFLGMKIPDMAARGAFLVFFLAVYAYLFYGLWREKESLLKRLVLSLAVTHLAFYFSLSTPFIYNYLIWGLPWLILCEWPMDTLLITLYSFAGIFSYAKRINYLLLIAAAVYLLTLGTQKFRSRLEMRRPMP